VFPILSVLPPIPRIKIVDVGAMQTVDEDCYAKLLAAVSCDVVGFEPVTEAYERLVAQKAPGRTYLPHVIGDGSTRTFHLCNGPYASSLFEPDMALADRFQDLADYLRVARKHEVCTMRLDDVSETAGMDFLKIDVQGAEMLVLEGSIQRLKTALIVQTEVSFVPLYKQQPMFADVDMFLRANGFQFHRLIPYGRPFKPLAIRNRPNGILSQILWADAIYVSDFMRLDHLPPEALLKLALILHENYQAVDFAAATLGVWDRRCGGQLQREYLRRLMLVLH
jgi:FkbM family methyltransferase